MNRFYFADSPEFSQVPFVSTPEQPSASASTSPAKEQSFVTNDTEWKLLNPVEIKVSPDQTPFVTPTEVKLNWKKKCDTFFQNRTPTPPIRRTFLPLLPLSPITDTLDIDECSKDFMMVTSRSLIDLSTTFTKLDMDTDWDSVMVTSKSFQSPRNLDCEMELGSRYNLGTVNNTVTPPQNKPKKVVSSETPVLSSGSRVRTYHDTHNMQKIRQRLEWDCSPIKVQKCKSYTPGKPAVKEMKEQQMKRSFLGELDPNIQMVSRKRRFRCIQENIKPCSKVDNAFKKLKLFR